MTKWETRSLKTMTVHSWANPETVKRRDSLSRTWVCSFNFYFQNFLFCGTWDFTLLPWPLKNDTKIYPNVTDLNVFSLLSGRTMSGQKGFVLVLKEQHRGLLLISVVKPLQLSPPSERCQKTPVVSPVHTRKTRQHFPQPPSLFQTSEK